MSILRSDDFLITTRVGDATRRIIWHGTDTIDLDLPHSWVLERHHDKFRILNQSFHPEPGKPLDEVIFDVPAPGERTLIELPPAAAPGPRRPLDIEIVHMKPLDPVYIMRHQMAPNLPYSVPKQLMQFYGEKYCLVRYRPVPPSRVVVNSGKEIFEYAKTSTGYAVATGLPGLRIKTAKGNYNFPTNSNVDLSEQAFFSATFIYGVHWWRFRMVPTPDSSPPIETEETEEDLREELRYKQSALVFLVVFLMVLSMMYTKSRHEKPTPKIVASTEIKLPKIIPPTKEELKPPPPPPPPPEPPKKEVVELKKPEPKVVELKPAKKSPKPKKVAKVAKPAPKMAPTPAPTPVAKKEPPKVDPAAVAAAKAAQQRAAEKVMMEQQLSKKLGFLSTSSKRTAIDPTAYEQKTGKFTDAPAIGAEVSKTNTLDKLVKDSPGGGGKISTNSARTVSSAMDFGSAKGKGLNDVQGKVSLNEIYGGGGAVGSGLGENGISVSGLGEVRETEIEAALAKFLQRFQNCYEKALLSDGSLGGKVVMQWTITASGSVQNPKVLTSQLNNNEVHGCISKVLKQIPFPKPKGGTVQVKKTFAFSSSTI